MPTLSPNAEIARLADIAWEGILERDPIWATFLGDERYADRLPDLGSEGRRRESQAMASLLDGLADVGSEDDLDTESLITRDLLTLVASNSLELLEAKQYQMAVDHISGVQTLCAQLAQYQPADTPERLRCLLARFAVYPTVVQEQLANLEEGIAEGRCSPIEPVRRTIEQIDGMLGIPATDSAPATMARVAREQDRASIVDHVRRHVYPALADLRDYLAHTYLAAARQTPGLHATSGGVEAYSVLIRARTTIEMSPEEVHHFGRQELERIEVELDEVAGSAGHRDRGTYKRYLAAEPSNRTDDRGRLVQLAAELMESASALAPRYFGRLPRAACDVLPVEDYREKDVGGAFYVPPNADGSRPGRYYVNTYRPAERQLHKLAGTTFHEGTPGHHFQLAIEMELDDLPAFRRFGTRRAGVAYVEGWGLYSERLADEMGLYQSDAQRFGMLEGQAFRAARLVVDSGLHAFGWNRARAVKFMERRGGMARTAAEIEVDRYSIWPAQAISYKVGQREIERARAETVKRLGTHLDLRRFHDEVLGHGSLPLQTLRSRLPGWVAAALEDGAPDGLS